MMSIDTPCQKRVQDLDLFLNLVKSLMMAYNKKAETGSFTRFNL
jgi:hypothetical protein